MYNIPAVIKVEAWVTCKIVGEMIQ